MSSFFKKHKSTPSDTTLDYRYPVQMGTQVPTGSALTLGPSPRTPSPTPSEVEELKKGAIDWKALFNWRNWAKRKYIIYYVAIIISGVIVALISIYHTQIVDALAPPSEFLRDLPGGWSIPIGIMFILSFPPLFGNEIVHVLCGIIWGLWIGFGIVCAGTFLGEVGNFYAFRYCCQARGDKFERDNLGYACLARSIRDGGFVVALVARLSIIPGHITTAIFSTCGMSIWSFCLGAFLSLPKQFATVYIGVILYQSAGQQTTNQKILSGVVLALTILVTIFAGWYNLRKMNQAKPLVLRDKRKARAMEKMYNDSRTPSSIEASLNSSGSTLKPGGAFDKSFNYSGSDVALPLSVRPQRWDANGRAILDNSNFTDGGPGYTGRPSGAGAPNIPSLSGHAPPDIRVIRASGASSIPPPSPGSPFDDPTPLPYDPTSTPKQHSYQTRPPMDRNDTQRTNGSSDDGHEGGPQWAAGMAKEDEKDVMTPLTASMRQANLPNRTHPVSQSSFNDVDLYTPGRRQWQATDGSDATFHTAEGSSEWAAPRPNQYPPAPNAYQQQRPPQQYGRQ